MAAIVPATAMLYISIAAMAASAAAAAYQGMSQAAAQKGEAKMQEYNAQVATNAAKIREDQQREQDRRILGAQRMGYAKAGVEMEGTPLLVALESTRQAELSAQRIRYGGELESQGWRNQAMMSRWGAKNSMTAGMIGAGSSLLTGAANVMKVAA